jgi:hypothetical protein
MGKNGLLGLANGVVRPWFVVPWPQRLAMFYSVNKANRTLL